MSIGSWRAALRMARRDATRSRGRSILVLVMIALPVLGVTAAAVVLKTAEISGAEALERRLGAADAAVRFEHGSDRVQQGFDPDQSSSWGGGRPRGPIRGIDDISEVLGRDVHAIAWREAERPVATDQGLVYASTAMLDLADPLASGIFRLEEGSLPGADDEVVINNELADRGYAVGDALEVRDAELTVVGIGESTRYRDSPQVYGPAEELGSARRSTWLVDAGPVSWDEVRELNRIGAFVLSRSVMEDPPPDSELPAEIRSWSSGDDAWFAVAALVVMMALIEVVLLAGPAFAVGARRQARNLALISAAGGTPRQARRVILASALVLGGVAAVSGILVGLGVAAAALPVVQRFDGSYFGPFDVPWLYLLGIAGFGLLSAFLAALVPAWLASRQDVVAVLAGRRGDRPAGMRSPVLGAVVLGIGIALSAYGAARSAGGEFVIAFAALPTMLGMILLIPLVVRTVARLARRLPLTLRFATRDAARHRTRTVPAVAAVAATVAGVVALGIANASDAAQSEAMYTPSLPMGQASLSFPPIPAADQARLRDAVVEGLPDNEVTTVLGMPENYGRNAYHEASFRVDGEEVEIGGWSSMFGSSVLVSDDATDLLLPGLSGAELAEAQEALDAGGAVVWSHPEQTADEVRIRVRSYGPDAGRGETTGSGSVPAYFARPDSSWMAPGQAVVSPAAAREVGLPARTVGLAIEGGVTEQEESDVNETLAGIEQDTGIYVERGPEKDDETVILLLVLGALGGLLMLGGTLTATFLALSDARPDLATLSAVGASPRARRGVAASYALVVGLVGAVVGAVVGFVPGIAASYALTGESWVPEEYRAGLPSNYLDIPWLLVGALVVFLPLLTATVVGLTARSRLPLVARVD